MAKFQNNNSHSSTHSSYTGNRSDNRTNWSDKYSGTQIGYSGGKTPVPTGAVALIAALIVALVALGLWSAPALLYRGQSEGVFVRRMLTECDDALVLANGLSRNGAADSSATLGRVRADIHAINTINELHNNVAGSYYVDTAVFTNLFSIIDSFYNNLKLGNVTMQNQTDLINGLNDLRVLLEKLQ